MADKQEANKKVVERWLTLLCIEKQPAKAIATLLGPVYRNHAFGQADNGEGQVEGLTALYASNPLFRTTIHRLIAEGDFVVAHHHLQFAENDNGVQVMDIFRLEDGKLVEHWDVTTPIPDGDPGPTPVF